MRCYLQVPREVDVEAVLDRQVITQQLERDDVQNALQHITRLRHTDRLRVLRHRRVVLIADDDRLRLARRDLRERALHLRVQRVARHDDDHRHVLVDERERAVLELAREDALRVHVADLLDLQRALQARRVLQPAPEDQQRPRVRERRVRQRLQRLVRLEHGLDLPRQRVQAVDDLLVSLDERDAVFGELDGHHEKHDVLRSVCLQEASANVIPSTFDMKHAKKKR